MKTTSQKERLYSKSKALPNGCIEWTGYCQAIGYGVISIGSRSDGSRRTILTHRLAWELEHGPIPQGSMVCHHCDNRACINPAHLFLGNQTDNMRDMIVKGRKRTTKGSSHPRAKVTPELAQEIKSMYRDGATQMHIARETGVAQSVVSLILRGGHWTNAI